MEASSLSVFAFSLSLISIALLVLLLLRHYLPLRTTPAYLLLPVFLSLFLPCSIILLVPIDIASSAVEEDGQPRGIWLPSGAMHYIWRITYWLTFALTWAVLPLLGEYSDSGAREPKDRMRYSLRANAKYQLITLAVGVAGLIYIVLQNGFHGPNVKALIMALAYSYGLILAIYLMGHGLVALPRRLLKGASVTGRLHQLQCSAPRLHDKLQDAMDKLEDLEATLRDVQRNKRPGMTKDLSEWVDDLAEPADYARTRSSPRASRPSPLSIPAVITERYLSDLSRRLKRARHARLRFLAEWHDLVTSASRSQAILDASTTRSLASSSSGKPLLTPTLRFHLYYHFLPSLRLLLASLLALASAGILYSEIAKSFAPAYSLISLTVVHHPSSTSVGKIGFAGQAIAAFWLCYMCATALTSMREVRIWGNRALVPRHTYAESACWYACQVAKLTVPLSYNFITLLPRDIHFNTTFYQFLGQLIDLTPLGTGFSRFFPVLIVLPVAATAFGLYGRVQRVFGFGAMEDELEGEEWREGKALIQREVLAGVGTRPGAGALGLSPRDASPSTTSPVERPGLRNGAAGRYSDFPPGLSAEEQNIGVSSPGAGQTRRARATRTMDGESVEAGGGWFSDLGHRLKNTIETVGDRPGLEFRMPERPKWLGGNGAENGAGGAARGQQGGGNALGRFFGGGGGGDGGGLRL